LYGLLKRTHVAENVGGKRISTTKLNMQY